MRAIFGIVAVISLAGWLISQLDIKLPQAPPPSPQLQISFTGWQDAVNETYGYRLKMPHDWQATRMEGEPAYPQRMQVINVKADEINKPHVGIIITVNSLNKLNLDKVPPVIDLIQQGHEQRQLKMAGEAALFFDGLGDSGEEFSVFLAHKENLFRFDWFGTHPDVRKQYKDVGLKVLASLKFL